MKIDFGKYEITSDEYLNLFKKSLLIRRFEELSAKLYGMGKIGGFCHLYVGQEIVATMFDMLKRKNDPVITSYRCHAHSLLSGDTPSSVMAELFGKFSGVSKGKGGSMHMFNKVGNFYGGHGIVGAQVPLGTGIAFADKYQKKDNVSIVYLGDGAVNQGQVFEAFNLATLHSLPIIYVIENNEYSMGTSVSRSSYITDLYKKGLSFGIDGIRSDVYNIEDFYNSSRQVIEHVRQNSFPFIIEAKTYRYKGHSMSDPGKYRSKEELEKYKNNDAIFNIRDIILNKNILTEDKLKSIEKDIKNIIKEASSIAESSPFPPSCELYTDVYSE
ncbi:MAG TPA: pyruvate dehydrogenase (acetyl-transferring) E1 component subunit alpha [Candidatus Megaira endosymbiont of Hartmannula sinica]|nr:pyruvate dehydrogenase (acetyl-transferring) E1 component subunit alpha [Candidatus Megaera endosymbiont of Hartmannula sinica]